MEQSIEALEPQIIPADTPPLSVTGPYMAILFVLISLTALADRMVQAKRSPMIVTREFKQFQRSYLNVYLCALGAEWLQDSHLFAVLLRHGHSISDVAILFAASFLTSYLFGAMTSSLPQGTSGVFGGRKRACLACFVFYGVAGLTLLQDEFAALLLGRVVYGIGTALLHTVFDAFMTAEHTSNAFPEEWLIQTYQEVSRYTTVVSIGAGVVAEIAAMNGGLVAPFLLSSGLCMMGFLQISRSWDSLERGGSCDCAVLGDLCSNISHGIGGIFQLAHSQDKGAFFLVLVQAFFEATMYITLFMWTPVLQRSAVEEYGLGTPPPYGVIFSLLMASLMLGSLAFQIMTSSPNSSFTPQRLCGGVCAMGSVACLALALVGDSSHWEGLMALLVFQFCVGVYYPSIGFLRGVYVPFESRNLVAQFSKTLLAAIVLVLLVNFAAMSSLMFLVCAVLLGASFVLLSCAAQEKAEEEKKLKDTVPQAEDKFFTNA